METAMLTIALRTIETSPCPSLKRLFGYQHAHRAVGGGIVTPRRETQLRAEPPLRRQQILTRPIVVLIALSMICRLALGAVIFDHGELTTLMWLLLIPWVEDFYVLAAVLWGRR